MDRESLLHFLMGEAIAQAQLAFSAGEVPVGAVLAYRGEIIARAHNLTETNNDATLHAELQVIREASKKLGNWRLSEGVLCVTLEPCVMCAGALRLTRVSHLVIGASESRYSAEALAGDVLRSRVFGAIPEVTRGIREEECSELLRGFFQIQRRRKNESENLIEGAALK